jgi:hypothetical protein
MFMIGWLSHDSAALDLSVSVAARPQLVIAKEQAKINYPPARGDSLAVTTRSTIGADRLGGDLLNHPHDHEQDHRPDKGEDNRAE